MSTLLQSYNPVNADLVSEFSQTDPKNVDHHVQTARRGFKIWQETSLKERVLCLRRAQELLLERQDIFADMITREMGRPKVESKVLEISASLDVMDYYARHARRFLDTRSVPLHNLFFKFRSSRLHIQPLGVLGIITPWNWPLLIPLGCVVPALVSGNAIVFKPSEITPGVGHLIHQLFLDAGVPESIFQIIDGRGDVGCALVQSSVEKIFFVGSTEVGQMIMEEASRNLKKVVLELGGHDPAIVCEDTDLDITTSGILWGSFCNAGQNCNGIERVYVHEKIKNDFLKIFLAKVQQLRLGNGMDSKTDMGPLALKKEVVKMQTIVQKAKEKGANVLTGGSVQSELGEQFFQPTVLYHPTKESLPDDVEYFGPIVSIIPFSDDTEAIEMANQSQFGLAASVWSENKTRAERIADKIEAGTVMINDAIVSFGIPESDWTGVKNSGVGWVHGEKGLDEMVNMKYVHRDRLSHSQNFWWFPYHAGMLNQIRLGCELLYRQSFLPKIKVTVPVLKAFFSYLVVNRQKKAKL